MSFSMTFLFLLSSKYIVWGNAEKHKIQLNITVSICQKTKWSLKPYLQKNSLIKEVASKIYIPFIMAFFYFYNPLI